MISVIIPYYYNSDGLAVLLTLLQAQTTPPKLIIVIDNSTNQEGAHICKKYKYNVPIKIYFTAGTIYESWNKAIQSTKNDVLILNDDVLLSINCIETLEKAKKISPALCYVPNTPSIKHQKGVMFTKNFRWFSSAKFIFRQTIWMPGFCFFLPRKTINAIGLFDTKFKFWYGDFDYQERLLSFAKRKQISAICRIDNLHIYHFGRMSLDITNPIIQRGIKMDLQNFNKKYRNTEYQEIVLKKIIRENNLFRLL